MSTLFQKTPIADSDEGLYKAAEFGRAALVLRKLILLLVFLSFGIVLVHAAWWDTPSMDEGIHIPSGVSYLDLGDPRMNFEHPPLMKLLAGTGAALAGAHVEASSAAWLNNDEVQLRLEFQDAFPGAKMRRIVFASRLPMILLTLLLGALVYLYSRRLNGAWGGVLSLLFFVTYPLILAFGSSVLNDVLVTLGFLATCLAIVRLWREPDLRGSLLYGGALGFALIAKFSALVLLPFSLLCWAVLAWRKHTSSGRELRRLAGFACLGLLFACALTWITYFAAFRHADARAFAAAYCEEPIPQAGTPAFAAARTRVQMFARLDEHPALERALMPAFYYFAGVRFVMRAEARPVYLLGRAYKTGQWFYFPGLVLLKSSPGFLAMLVLGLFLVARTRVWRTASPEAIVLAIFFCVYTFVAMRMKLNIGLRHYMPGLVSLMVLMGMAVPALRTLSRRRRVWWSAAVAVSLASALVTAVAHYPYYVPYYNMLRMNAPGGWIASNSDIDFGMYMRAGDEFAVAHHVPAVAVVPFSSDAYHLNDLLTAADPWQCRQPDLPPERWLIVSTSQFYDPRHPGQCDYLLSYPHQPMAGGSLEVFDLRRVAR